MAKTLPTVRSTTSALTFGDRWDHFLARWGVNRMGHRVDPGLYALGDPDADSPVFVTANYTLSFDALRSALARIDGYILVLDTHGINVWCAAGKGTFGTDELVRRIEATRLSQVVGHRVLILPQLGAPGVSAHEVKKRSGFRVEYGPVRAADLPAYLETHRATPEMRRVRFDLRDRLVLIPVELVHVFLPTLAAAAVLLLIAGPLAAAGVATAVLTGVVLFPILLPWLPGQAFSVKGFVLGGMITLPFALAALLGMRSDLLGLRVGWALTYLLALPPITAYLALNFTGSTTFTSKSAVQREMKRAIPVMAWMVGLGVVLTVAFGLYSLLG
ncbi:MAG: mercury methylation corrinoid protein HgcA [Anaerolineae bacterium]|jgi:hypothetical protein